MAKKERGTLRIIGGAWRGRRLSISDAREVRPTSDRVRETLFNWLMPFISGAHCLDLYAGTGALGLESLSRGAQRCDFVEHDHPTAQLLSKSIDVLGCGENASVVHGDALDFLAQYSGSGWDVVFLDPPFGDGRPQAAFEAVAGGDVLNPGGFVYIEHSAHEAIQVGPDWNLWRQKRAGDVVFGLYKKELAENRT
ncbi:MAG: 16S rRNA (guanine(966)-N(2))-methyltransferase RsmD [Pseudomonadota bacterium]